MEVEECFELAVEVKVDLGVGIGPIQTEGAHYSAVDVSELLLSELRVGEERFEADFVVLLDYFQGLVQVLDLAFQHF